MRKIIILPYTGRKIRDEIHYEPLGVRIRLWRNKKPTDFSIGCLPGEQEEFDRLFGKSVCDRSIEYIG
jgi:hypothetical protein